MANNPDIALHLFEIQTDVALKYGINLSSRTVQIVGEIDQNMFILVDTALTLLESNSKAAITIRINSEGGSVYDAMAIVGRMRSSKCQIITEGFGCIMSAASLILAAGEKRRMSEFSTFMHHETGVSEFGGTLAQIEHHVVQLKKESEFWCTQMEKFSNKNYEFWNSTGLLGKDLFLSAEECLDYGIIDEVI